MSFRGRAGLVSLWGLSRINAWRADRRARIIRKIFFVSRFVAGLGLSACWVLHAWGANRRFRLIRKILFLFVVSCPGFFTLGVQTGRPNNSEDFIFVCRFVAGLGLCLCWVLHALGADRRARIIRKILFLFVVSWLGVASAPVRFFKLGVQTDSPE